MAGKVKRFYPERCIYEVGKRLHNFVLSAELPMRTAKTGRVYTQWECKCNCGVKFITTTKAIKKGKKSCGCLSTSAWFKKTPTDEFIANVKYNHYKQRAKARKKEFKITRVDFKELIFSNCFYCGLPPHMNFKKGKVHMGKVNGVDRQNSSLGYVAGNCVPCCRFCNCAKGDASLEDFMEWLRRVKDEKRD